MILGDAIACPLQITEPDLGVSADVDPELARRTREMIVREMEARTPPARTSQRSPSVGSCKDRGGLTTRGELAASCPGHFGETIRSCKK